jgi:hypothetical protein
MRPAVPNCGRPRRGPRRVSSFCSKPLPVHSAHVGQELEVHYRWHPYFGSKVSIRRVEQRATGRFLKVLGPAGVVVSIADWMLDPVACAGMAMGAPRVKRYGPRAGTCLTTSDIALAHLAFLVHLGLNLRAGLPMYSVLGATTEREDAYNRGGN